MGTAISAACLEETAGLAHALRETLAASFGVPFFILEMEELGDLSAASEGFPFELSESLRERLMREFESRQTSFALPLGRSQSLLAIPVVSENFADGRCLVLGKIYASEGRLGTALADAELSSLRQELQIRQLQQQNELCVQQITLDFEELSWLRSIMGQFEIGDIQEGLAPLVRKVFPSLRELIAAEAIYYFTQDREAPQGQKFRLLHAAGNFTGALDSARELVNELSSRPHRDVHVFNARGAEHIPFHNYICAAVAQLGEQRGWILVINKSPPTERLFYESGTAACDPNLFEFGTTEAGLLQTVCGMLATHERNVELFRDRDAMTHGVMRALINTIDAKDAYTCGHSDRVASMSKSIAEQLGLSAEECERIRIAGLLHDVGKIGVPDQVLGKPGKLTEEEFDMVKRHPVIGYEILKPVERLRFILPGVLHHHEAFDGRGYPHGLVGEHIPLQARIIAVADSYDAMTSRRPYRDGLPTSTAEKVLRDGIGRQWDPKIVEAFFRSIDDIYAICQITPDH